MRNHPTSSQPEGTYRSGRPRLTTSRKQVPNTELHWNAREKKGLAERIMRLRVDQIAALLEITGVRFSREVLDKVAQEIKTDGLASGHLEILLAEADSKDVLLWWMAYFELHAR